WLRSPTELRFQERLLARIDGPAALANVEHPRRVADDRVEAAVSKGRIRRSRHRCAQTPEDCSAVSAREPPHSGGFSALSTWESSCAPLRVLLRVPAPRVLRSAQRGDR